MAVLNVLTCLLILPAAEQFMFGACPLNSHKCIDIARYNGRQYGTCVTDKYMKEFSGFRHQCEDQTATYCWYQCMLETHDKNDGDVTPDCSCESLNTTSPPDDLPADCYSPSGADCSWYTRCLQKRYPCRNDHEYAVNFAHNFCVMYSKHYKNFSHRGKAWVDAVRKCLQVKLVPTLRPGQHKTCAELRDFAFGTHTGCYISPDNNRLSFCKLGVTDFLKVSWTIIQGFSEMRLSQVMTAMWPTFASMFSLGGNCFGNFIANAYMDAVDVRILSNPFISQKFKNQTWDHLMNRHRDRRSLPDGYTPGTDIIYKVTNQLSTTMKWTEKDIMWFGFPASVKDINGTGQSTLTIRIFVAPKAMYDLNAENVSVGNVSVAIHDLSNAIERGEFKFDLGKGNTAELFRVCSDINCGNSTFEVVPQNVDKSDEQDKDGGNLVRNVLIGCGVGIAFCIIAGVVFYKLRQ